MRSTRSSRRERRQHARRGLAQVRMDRVLVLYEIAEVAVLLVADGRFERQRLGDFQNLGTS
jgi:hypothetical protein